MSGSSSDWSKLNEDRNPVGGLAQSSIAAISEILESVVCIQIEKENFIQIGCFFYRISVVLMELQINRFTPTNVLETLQSLLRNINLAKDLAIKLQKNENTIHSSNVREAMEQLEGLMRNIGENLGLIPLATYEDQEYVEKAAKALSKEMKIAHFVVGIVQDSKSKNQMLLPFEIMREERAEVETDLYSIDVEESSVNIQLPDSSEIYQTDSGTIRRNKYKYEEWSRGSSMHLPQAAECLEPLYETFFCPLTKEIMDDPVNVESGVTYERKAITEWFDKLENEEDISCPKSGQKLKSRILSTNVALKATIDEWKERNEAARIKIARAALSLASTDNMVLEAIDDLRYICKRKPYNKVQVRNMGMIPLLAHFIESKNRTIRCATLELLRQLAEDDDDCQEIIAKSVDISITIKMLSSSHQPTRHASMLLLLELSRSQFLCEKIGAVAGGILMLITIKYRQSIDAFTSEIVDKILKNLERVPHSIKLMAENGFWEPLLSHLLEGTEEMRMEMANYLGEIVLGHDSMTYVAERASPALIQMVQSGNSLSRNAAFRALNQISCHHPNAKTLAEAGIMRIMAQEMFTRTIHNEPMNSKIEAAAILANVLESGLELENVQVSTHGHTVASDYIVYNMICIVKSSAPDELNINILRILLCLMKFPKPAATVVSVVKETEASYNLMELINSPNEELGIASIKLLLTLSAFMGHTLADRLCKTRDQPNNLIQILTESTRIEEKQAVSANFLAKLPHQNLVLNLSLVNCNAVPAIIQKLSQMQRIGTRSSRYASIYFEGIVGILVRFTTTLYDHQILFLARTYNLAAILTELLTMSFSDEVQKLSAIGLENLSKQSTNLSRPPQMKKTKVMKYFLIHKCMSRRSFKDDNLSLCPIHRGVCSSQDTFCLLDAEAVDRLLACLDHDNVEVVDAALSALCTLLDEKVDLDKSVKYLSEKHAIQHVLKVVKEHKEESVRQKSFWVVEKFLTEGGDESVSSLSQDKLFPATLVSAFHHGDEYTRQMAEKILRHLNKMPNLSNTITFTT